MEKPSKKNMERSDNILRIVNLTSQMTTSKDEHEAIALLISASHVQLSRAILAFSISCMFVIMMRADLFSKSPVFSCSATQPLYQERQKVRVKETRCFKRTPSAKGNTAE